MSKQIEDFDANLAGEDGKTEETKSSWFKRMKKGINTKTSEKKETPEGLWVKCPDCNHIGTMNDLREVLFVCPKCNFHHRINSNEYYDLLFDNSEYTELFENIRSKDFEFIGGSLGSVMGEKFSRAVDHCLKNNMPYMVISKSGGARMMESAFSLMQLAKTSGKLSQLSDAKLPYISLLTDPTFGGISASFGMLGDLNIAEPNALIGFAGPRVIKETIKKDLPEGFQRSEFILEHGFLDFIVPRKELKQKLAIVLTHFKN